MKWALIAGGVVIAIVLVVVLIGVMLPKGHTASVAVRIRQPPSVVWQTIAEMGAWPTWNPDIKAMTKGPDREGRPYWTQETSQGALPVIVEESRPPADGQPGRMATRIADPDLPFGGAWIWEVAPDGAGTRVTLTEEGEIYNPIFRFVARFFMGYQGTMEGYLSALARKFGETVTPEKSTVTHR
jgi:hypothetical protein